MRVYKVTYEFKFTTSNETGIPQPEDDPESLQIAESEFYFGTDVMERAYNYASSFLDEGFGQDGYKIIGVNPIPGLDVLMWDHEEDGEDEGYEHICNAEECPYANINSIPHDDIMSFNCDCGYKIRVVNNEWESICCKGCNKLILREEVKLEKGRFIYKERNDDGISGPDIEA
jgi:hypothetical protein